MRTPTRVRAGHGDLQLQGLVVVRHLKALLYIILYLPAIINSYNMYELKFYIVYLYSPSIIAI